MANPSPPACLWLNARRPASDSMPAGLPLTQCPPACLWFSPARSAADSSSPDCRWLKLAGLPLIQARRIAADSCHWSSAGKANSPPLCFTPPSAAHQCFTCFFYAGKATRRPRFTRPAAGWGSLQPAGPCRWVVKPAGCCRYCQASRSWYPQPAAAVLTSQPAVAVIDQSVTTVFLTVFVCSPRRAPDTPSFPKEIFGGGSRAPAEETEVGAGAWGRGLWGGPTMASRAPCSAMASRAPSSAMASRAPCSTWTSVCLFHSGGPVLCMYQCRSCGVSRVPTPPPW